MVPKDDSEFPPPVAKPGKFRSALTKISRTFTVLSYPTALLFLASCWWPNTHVHARRFKLSLLALWIPLSGAFYYYMIMVCDWHIVVKLVLHFVYFWAIDNAFGWTIFGMAVLERVLNRDVCTNRLMNDSGKPRFLGPKICVLGNGPSLVKGEPRGDLIDEMDEVVRFNNFQTKTSECAAWTGTKTTVHFSDGMLMPTYYDYRVPNTCVVLSLFMERLMYGLTYILFRAAIDLCAPEALRLMLSPKIGWVSLNDIRTLKAKLGVIKFKNPTSGVLAIDWMVRNRPDPSVPVYIDGFDFFQGGQVHYYSKREPLYERMNDLAGVFLGHEPSKERAFVNKLVEEGKVQWLRSLRAAGSN
jgi:hypothetical protein